MRFYRSDRHPLPAPLAVVLSLSMACASTIASEVPASPAAAPDTRAAEPPASGPQATTVAPEAPAQDTGDAPAPRRKFEAAIGLRAGYGPEYIGASRSDFGATPAIYLRYGRLSLSSASGLIDRRNDDVLRGLGVDLSRSDTFRAGLSLRYDDGRSSDDKEGLRGIGGVSSTVRVRGALQWRLPDNWRVSAALTPDLFDRGGGTLLEGGVSREWRFDARTRWRIGGSLTWANGEYMRSYFGVDEEGSAASGLPVYEPGSGWRDLGLSTRLRFDINRRWTVNGGVGLTRVLGPARDSPFTEDTLTFGVSAGAVYWLVP
jgi:outer membrane scaffolding protein for murein synthesis (MipA/OmpV family)